MKKLVEVFSSQTGLHVEMTVMDPVMKKKSTKLSIKSQLLNLQPLQSLLLENPSNSFFTAAPATNTIPVEIKTLTQCAMCKAIQITLRS